MPYRVTQLSEDGRFELPDPNPIQKALKFQGKVSTLDEMRRMYHLANQYAEQQGLETAQEADDFIVDDDLDGPLTTYEIDRMDALHAEAIRRFPDPPPPPSPTPAPSPSPSPAPSQG